MSKKTKEVKIQGLIRKGIYEASLQESESLPTNITVSEFSRLVATSPSNQLLSLFEKSATHPNLGDLTVSQTLTNTRSFDKILDDAFIGLPRF